MGTPPRNFVAERIYHIYSRGNHKERIFLVPDDYLFFLMRLNDYADFCNIELIAYCLMPNHYHLLLKQKTGGTVTDLMRRLNISYAKHFNWQYHQVGHVYQGRYGARLIADDDDLANMARYIHRNPSSFADPYRYQWSDISRYINRTDDGFLLKTLGWNAQQYLEFISIA